MMKAKPLAIALSIAALAFAPLAYQPVVEAQATAAIQPKEGWYKGLVDFDAVKPHAEMPKDPENKANTLLVDSRPAARRYDIGHIPTAINIPDSQFEKLAPTMLPADKATPIIFYCQGFECDLSHKSAFKAEAMGYTNIKVYPAGIPEWESKGELVGVSLAHIKKLIDEKADVVLIDSRPERVFGQGSIPGAINIPDSKFDKDAAKLPASKDTTLIFFCNGLKCDLSPKSAVKAKALGYTKVFIYPQGYPEWQAKMGGPGGSIAQGAQGIASVFAKAALASSLTIEGGKEKGSISVPSFERILSQDPSFAMIVDVRDEKDFKKSTFPGAVNIPINELEKKIGTLPKNKPVIFICSTGARSGEAYDTVKLLDSSISAYFLDADVTFMEGNVFKIKGR